MLSILSSLVSPSLQRQLSGSWPSHMAFMSRSGLTRVSVLRSDPSAHVQMSGRHLRREAEV